MGFSAATMSKSGAAGPLLMERVDAAVRTRATEVAKAKRSKKVTPDGFPVRDFRGILKTLSTQTQQIVQPPVAKLPTFRRVTPVTPYQKKAFDLLQLGAS